MANPIGTSYHNLNTSMINADLKVGEAAARVDAEYAAHKMSTGKKWLIGILSLATVGVAGLIYGIAHSVRMSGLRSQMQKLSQGTRNFYEALDALEKSPQSEDFSRDVTMCGEKARLVRDTSGVRIVFSDNSDKAVRSPSDVMHQIEIDVMRHSEHFDKAFVEMLLTKYRDASLSAPIARENLGQDFNDLQQAGSDYRNNRINGLQGLGRVYAAGKKVTQVPLTEARSRCSELLGELFKSRLGFADGEVDYIDLGLGIKLAGAVMDGSVKTAEDARAFVNRNACSNHFTTVESAGIFAKYEKALRDEKTSQLKGVSTNAVTFRDTYTDRKPSPALPQGEDRAVHDFIADIISSDYAPERDRALDKRTVDGTVTGERLRELFFENRELVAKLMENRARRLAGEDVPDLLGTIDPKLREAVGEQLDKLNERYEKARTEGLAERANLTRELARSGQSDRDIERIQDKIDALNERWDGSVKGRKLFVEVAMSDLERSEKNLRTKLGTRHVDEIHDRDLDMMGESNALEDNEQIQSLKAQHDGYLSSAKNDIQLGLDFFADMEKKLDENFRQAAIDLQNQVKAQINEIFKEPSAPKSLSDEELRSASLKDVIGNPGANGEMQLIRKALERYFSRMPVIDQRAMLAAGTRYAVEGASSGAKLGAVLKGAGPVMQKMLQGLDPSMFDNEDFRLALGDMKDRLAPISQRAIQAHLYHIVSQSGGAIRSIEVVKALGAASVAQALQCRLVKSDGNVVDCVVKILRPEAAQRARREEAVFMEAARDVGNGMELTFQGQFKSILDELDLRTEAKNVIDGNTVYDYEKSDYTNDTVRERKHYGSFANVHAMRLVEGIEPSVNVLVLERVPGSTLEGYLRETASEGENIVRSAQTEIEARGPENGPQTAFDKACRLGVIYRDLRTKYEALINLAYMWTNEGLFAEGFYHGDVHKGNIMVDDGWRARDGAPVNTDYRGATLIDFGNATRLNAEGRKSVVQVVAGTAVADPKLFAKGFKALLSPESLAKFNEAGDELINRIGIVLEKGTLSDTGARLAAVLALLQRDYQIEVPGEIHNFLESQRRLQTAIDETGSLLQRIAREQRELITPHLEQLSSEDRTQVETDLNDFAAYRPKSMIGCLTDVVMQNLHGALKSIGLKKGAQCFARLRGELDAINASEDHPAGGDLGEVPLAMDPNAISA